MTTNTQGMSVPKTDFRVWKTLMLGTGPSTPSDFIQALKIADCEIDEWGIGILNSPEFTMNMLFTELDLVVIPRRYFSLNVGTSDLEMFDKARECGLELCPAEVGPQLGLQYRDQCPGEHLYVAMEPMVPVSGSNTAGIRRLFTVQANRQYPNGPVVRKLSGFHMSRYTNPRYGRNGEMCYGIPNDRWVFVKPRK
jgi:hypothetical protein